MKIKLGYQIFWNSMDEMISEGLRAGEYGFDSIWIPDHLVTSNPSLECPDTWLLLTTIGLKTKHTLLCSGVTDPFRRHPATIAQTTATLDRLTRGRAVLGIGAGEKMNLTPYGIPWDRPVKRLKESVLFIRNLWSASIDHPANYEGQHYSLNDAFLTIRPVQKPYPPIYIGALGRKTRELTGELADGWYPTIVLPEHYSTLLLDIKRGAAKTGRNLDEVDMVARIYFATLLDYERNKPRIVSGMKRMLLLERSTLQLLGYDLDLPEELRLQKVISGKQEQMIKEYMEKIPNEVVDLMVDSSKSNCLEKIQRFIRNGATHIVLRNYGGDKTMEDFKDIIEYVNT